MKIKLANKAVYILVVLAVLAGIFFYRTYEEREVVRQKEEYRNTIILKNAEKLGVLDLEAKAVSVYNATIHQKIYGKNDTEVLPMASLAKSLSTIVALEDSQDDQIRVSASALGELGDNGLYAEELWDKQELAKFSLVVSSNDGIKALGEAKPDFINKVNEKSKKIGLTKTYFVNGSGLDLEDGSGGAYTTAEEANKIALFSLRARPDIFRATAEANLAFKSYSGFKHIAQNTDIIVDKIPNLLFSKTGNTDLAGGNLTIVFKNKHEQTFAVTVLGSTQLGRFSDMQKIVSVLEEFVI